MTAPKVTIIDYGVGNLLSVKRGFERCGASVTVASDSRTILTSDKIVLPGVGAFPRAMEALNKLDLVPVIREFAQSNKPLLAICLGMQLLLDHSQEFGNTPGLGLIPGSVKQVPKKDLLGGRQKIPHIGWNELELPEVPRNWSHTILASNRIKDSVYFVHSFMAVPTHSEHRIADTIYGGHRISAVISKNKIYGCQFHPEKSGEVGLRLLKEFVAL